VVADRHLRLPLTSTLVKTARTQPTWVITGVETVEHNASHATELREAGVVLHAVTDGALAPATILTTLAAAGITRVLVEAGAQLSTAFVAAGMVETLHWYRAPLLLGNTGKPSLAALHSTLKDAHRHAVIETRRLGVDTYERIELH
jgi:diaminohydroxyphosphoribosylaminopyrimidine deaminase/5-amino-6-(5-phosphoribosylamino)uracil reductase